MPIRIVTPTNHDEWRPFDQLIAASFGARWEETKPEDVVAAAHETPYDFRIGVMDGETPIGGCASYEFDLSLPGGGVVSVAALTAVGGDASKSGRGALRAMLHEHLVRAKDRGHAASILNASEASLYGQFGYGHATTMVGYEVDPDRCRFREPLADPGTIDLMPELKAATGDFMAAYDACASSVPGTGGRDRIWWERVFAEKKNWRGGGSMIGVIHRDAAGAPDGYLLYEIEEKSSWVNEDVLTIRELLGASVTTELALFEFATRVPLKRKIRWPEGPVDFPVRHHLFDPRQLHVVDEHDLLWLRPLNVQQLLVGRNYAADGVFTLAVDDELFADQRGPWRLTIEAGRASVAATSAGPDLVVTPQQVGMVLLGDHRLQELVHAGVLHGDPDVIRRLDQAFLTGRRPYNLSKF